MGAVSPRLSPRCCSSLSSSVCQPPRWSLSWNLKDFLRLRSCLLSAFSSSRPSFSSLPSSSFSSCRFRSLQNHHSSALGPCALPELLCQLRVQAASLPVHCLQPLFLSSRDCRLSCIGLHMPAQSLRQGSQLLPSCQFWDLGPY